MMKATAITRSIIYELGKVKRKFPNFTYYYDTSSNNSNNNRNSSSSSRGPPLIKYFSTSASSSSEEAISTEGINSLYFWGTPNKGTIPTKEVLDSGRGESDKSQESLVDRFKSETALDSPTEIDINDAFGIDNQNDTIRDIICGPTSTAIILSNNTAFTFGNNQNGQLGHGYRKKDVLVPTLLNPPESSALRHDQISKIKMGNNFTAIIDTNGDLYTCGYNGSTLSEGIGCLGHGYFPEEYLDSPTLVESLVEDGCSVDQVAVGSSHMVVLTTEKEVLTCGSALWGRIGNLDSSDQLYLEPVEMLVGETDICQIESGKDFSMALTEGDGIIYVWGKNDKGQCGTGSGLSVQMYAMEPMPVPIEGMLEGRKVVKISAGHSHAAALTDKGELFMWGMNIHPQPEQITELANRKIIDVQCGKGYTMALDADGKVYTFGEKVQKGVLGLGNQKKAITPTLIDGLVGKKVSLISAGWNHVACLTD